MYNFEVEDYHTYYVSDTKVLVHNSNACDVDFTKKGTAPKFKGESGVYEHQFSDGMTYTGQAKDLGVRPARSLKKLQDGLAQGYEYIGTKVHVVKKATKAKLDKLEGKKLRNNGGHKSEKTFNQRDAPNQPK